MESVTRIHHTSNSFINWKQLFRVAQLPLASHTPSLPDGHHNAARATDGAASKLNVMVRNNGANLPAILRAVDWRCQEAR